MPETRRCPDPRQLQRLLLGQLPEAAADVLERHVEGCETCGRLLPTLQADDTLVEAMRSHTRLSLAAADRRAIQGLIPRLQRLHPATISGRGGARGMQPQGDTPAMATNLGSLDFLSPPKGPGEMGRLGSYRVLKLLGQGGMGMVFLAEDPQLQRTVALKAMLPEVAKRDVSRERFLREARATAKIEHDHIVTIYQVGEDRGVPFLAMQLLKGMTLDDYLQKKASKTGTLPVDQVLKLGREIARGLAAAHEHGLIHRDIKPANIWLDATASGRVKILDFGLAQAAEGDKRLTQLGMIVGTPAYMPPEQARSDKVDGRADLFSLGVVLFKLCTGKLPWKGGDAMETMVAIATEEPVPIQQLNPELPPKLAKLIMKLLARKADDRPPSAKAVADAIQAIERDLPNKGKTQVKMAVPVAAPVPATSLGWHDPTQTTGMLVGRPAYQAKARRRSLALFAVAAAFAVTAVAAAVIYIQTDTGTLKVETDDPDVRVIVEQNGKQIEIIDKKKGTKVTLNSGEYRLRLGEPRKDIKLDKDRIQITRNGVAIVTISKAPEVAAIKSKDPPTTRTKDPKTTKPKVPFQTKPKDQPTKRPDDPPPIKTPDDPPPLKKKEPPDNPPPGPVKYLTNSIGMELAPIKPGEFVMGSSPEEIKRYQVPGFSRNEGPAHRVKITKAFYMGRYPVTLKQYFDFLQASGYQPDFKRRQVAIPYRQGPTHPVVFVSWDDSVAYCDWLSKKEGRTYRLPTEAEWEYACRAGSQTAFFFGDDAAMLGKYAWFSNNSDKQAHPVGTREPNPWGLYDMLGNVYQWTADWAAPDYYKNSPLHDPRGAAQPLGKEAHKVMRGGEYSYDAAACRSASRKDRPTHYATGRTGFRVVLEAPVK